MPGKRVVEKVEAKQTLTAVLLADSFTQVGGHGVHHASLLVFSLSIYVAV